MTILTIETMGARGDGVANGCFIAGTLPGEVVRVDGEGPRPALVTILTPSPERVEPPCPFYARCGGCALQHWRHDRYLAWKRGLVAESLAAAGLKTDVAPIIDAHGDGRRRAVIHARKDADGAYHVGFNAAREHRVTHIDACLLFAPDMQEAFAFARLLTDRLKASNSPIDYQITATLHGLDIDIRGIPPKSRPSDKTLIALADRPGLARLTWNGQLVFQRGTPAVMVEQARLILPPAAFLQATKAAEDILSRLVREAAGPKAGQILDLFCGVGTFTFPLARIGKVKAADSSQEAIAALKDAARFLTGVKTIDAETRDLFRRPYLPQELKTVDLVVFDPPRAGAEAQAAALGASRVAKIIAVSCNLTTFIRDALILQKAGFSLEQVTPVDQFRFSAHVELVGIFRR